VRRLPPKRKPVPLAFAHGRFSGTHFAHGCFFFTPPSDGAAADQATHFLNLTPQVRLLDFDAGR
jgi:hypothetical protein